MDREAWWAIVHEVTKSWTRLNDSRTHTHTHTHTECWSLGDPSRSPEEEFDTEVRLCHIVKPHMLMLTEKKNIM